MIIGSGGGNISCTATGVPIPTITWTDNNQSTTPFMQYDVITDNSVVTDGGGATTFIEGSIVSTLLIVNPLYPDDLYDEVMYTCTGGNEHGNTSVMITVQILGNRFVQLTLFYILD